MSKTVTKRKISEKIIKLKRSYTYNQKIKILEQLKESNLSVLAFSKQINVPTRTIQNWTSSEDTILMAQKKLEKKWKK